MGSACLGLLAVALAAGQDGGDGFRVGVAQVDITPPVGWRLAGGFEHEPSRAVHDPLYAKAIVFRRGQESFALVICDLTGMPRETAAEARRVASERSGIPADKISVGATHTHGAPLFYDYRRDLFHARSIAAKGSDPHEPMDYERFLVAGVADAIRRASESTRPARLRQRIAKVPGLAFNRRFHMKDGSVAFNPGKKNPEIVRPAGPVDDSLHVLLVEDAETGVPFASLTTFAMHVATFGDGTLGADFPKHLQDALRERHGPSFLSVFAEGTAGDVNHIDVQSAEEQTSEVEPARIGRALATAMLAGEDSFKPVAAPTVSARSETIHVPLREADDGVVAKAKEVLDRAEGPTFLEVVEAHRQVDVAEARRRHGPILPMDVRTVRLGDEVALVMLPHEVFVELGLAIKARSPFPNTFVLSLCDGVDFYVPTEKAFREGSYEVVNSRVEAGAGEKLVEAAVRSLADLGRRAKGR